MKGRTGRAGKTGDSFTFVSSADPSKTIRDLIDVLQRAKQEIPQDLQDLARGTFSRGGRGGSSYGGSYGGSSGYGSRPGGSYGAPYSSGSGGGYGMSNGGSGGSYGGGSYGGSSYGGAAVLPPSAPGYAPSYSAPMSSTPEPYVRIGEKRSREDDLDDRAIRRDDRDRDRRRSDSRDRRRRSDSRDRRRRSDSRDRR